MCNYSCGGSGNDDNICSGRGGCSSSISSNCYGGVVLVVAVVLL